MRLLRLSYALVRIPAELAAEVAKRAAGAAIGLVRGDQDQDVALREPPRPEHFRPPAPPPPPPPPPRAPRRARPGNGAAPPPEPAHVSEEPAHVSEEPVLVAEVAEQGAEDGAGAEVRVEEPWPGYDRMPAAEIVARLRTETPEVGAGVTLYEATHKNRRSVLDAAARATR
jgi:hypothetical protein